jgi:transposase
VSVIGIDLAQNVYRAHGVDDLERPVLFKQLRREQMMSFFAPLPSCLIGMEACGYRSRGRGHRAIFPQARLQHSGI